MDKHHRFHNATKVALGGMIATLIVLSLHLLNAYWAIYTVAITMQASYGATIQKGSLRILGTVTGTILGVILAIYTGQLPYLYVMLAISCLFCIYFAAGSNYVYAWLLLFPTTALVISNYLITPDTTINYAVHRIGDILIGVCIAFILARYLWPSYEHVQLRQKFNDFFSDFHKAYQDYTDYIENQHEIEYVNHNRIATLPSQINMMFLSLGFSKHERGIRPFNLTTVKQIIYYCRSLFYSLSEYYYLLPNLSKNPIIKLLSPELKEFHKELNMAILNIRDVMTSLEVPNVSYQHLLQFFARIENRWQSLKESGELCQYESKEVIIARMYTDKLKHFCDSFHNIGVLIAKSRHQETKHETTPRLKAHERFMHAKVRRGINRIQFNYALATTVAVMLCLLLQNLLHFSFYVSLIIIIQVALLYGTNIYITRWKLSWWLMVLAGIYGMVAIYVLNYFPSIYLVALFIGIALFIGEYSIRSHPKYTVAGMLFSVCAALLIAQPLSMTATWTFTGNIMAILLLAIPIGTYLCFIVAHLICPISVHRHIRANHYEFLTRMETHLCYLRNHDASTKAANTIAQSKRNLWAICEENWAFLADGRQPLFTFKKPVNEYEELARGERWLYYGMRLLEIYFYYEDESKYIQTTIKHFEEHLLALQTMLKTMSQKHHYVDQEEILRVQKAFHNDLEGFYKAHYDEEDFLIKLSDLAAVAVGLRFICQSLLLMQQQRARLFKKSSNVLASASPHQA